MVRSNGSSSRSARLPDGVVPLRLLPGRCTVSAVYNTSAAVVALVRADSEEHAVRRLHAALRAAGFEIYEGDNTSNAFESEDQSVPVDL